jgi:fructokinase
MPYAEPLYGCVEAGGTKFVLGIVAGPDDIRETHRLPTTKPEEVLPAMRAWFAARGRLAGFGIASFGPVDADPASPHWGRITETTKPGWSDADIAGALAGLGGPIGFDTDVNGAALGEHRWGAAKGDAVACYVTVGTGIGGGLVVEGKPVHGSRHPEMGHILARRHPDDDFPGVCSFHQDCFEGLASGPAISARWGTSLSELSADYPAHDIVAFYLGQLAVAIQAVASPPKIVMGGGVMGTPGLRDRVQAEANALARGYFAPQIVAPGLGEHSGLLGALALAMDATR